MSSIIWVFQVFFLHSPFSHAGFKAKIPPNTTQLISVSENRLFTYDFVKGEWQKQLEVPAVVGQKGFAELGKKREGDKKTPSGIFELVSAFGYAKKVKSKMPYQPVTKEDKFIDDVDHPDYNKWVKGETSAKSFEFLKRDDQQYEYAVIINYNMSPIVKGHGSAIFLHVWKSEKEGTAGCVGISREDIVRVLSWLDPNKKPFILLNDSP